MMHQNNQLSQKNLQRAPTGGNQAQVAAGQQPQYFATSWGLAAKGQLGYPYHQIKSINANQIGQLERDQNYLDISCGENHTLFLTDSLDIASCGSNTYGQLGIGQIQEKPANASIFKVLQPVGVSAQTQVQFDQVACGSEHSMALTTDGDLYSWGLNFKGQLGVGDFENRAQPLLIDSFVTGGNAINLPGSSTNNSSQQTKKYLVQMLKRSKSKETSAGGVAGVIGSQT